MQGILSGMRVIEGSAFVAAPLGGMTLAQLGADVIRFDAIGGGLDYGRWPVTVDGRSLFWDGLNKGKRSIAVDLRSPRGQEILTDLICGSEDDGGMFLTNFPARGWLDYESLKAIKSDIILTTVNAFGSGGPWSEKIGFDGLAQSMSGNLHLTGEADKPTRSNAPYVDFGTASLSAFATMAALMHRQQTGEGQMIEGALLKTALTFMNSSNIEQSLLGVDRVGSMNRGQTAGPADVFQTLDGWVMVLCIGEYQFGRVTECIGRPELANDARFKDDLARGEHGEELSAIVGQWCASRTNDEVLAAMEAAKVPAGPVYTPQQALDDPHINALGFHQPVDYPTAPSPAPIAQFPVSMSASPGEIRSRAPELGEHTDQILADLGYTEDQIGELRAARVV